MTSTFNEHMLPNGLRIICESMPRVRSAALGFLVRTGARHEHPHQHGVSHFLEHMCFKGTARRDCHSINVRFDELGSIYNAFTGKEHTVYYGWVPAEQGEPQLELLSDMLRPALPPAEFETERKVILEEIAMSYDSFDHHVWNFLHRCVFGEHSLAHEILGEKETIETLPRQVMAEYHARRYAPTNVTLLACGALDPRQVFEAAGRFCGDWAADPAGGDGVPRNAPPPPPTGQRSLTLEQFNQQAVVLLYPSVPQTDKRSETIEALTGLLGGHNSRCYWNIVQKGVCSQAGAAWLAYADYGLFGLSADGKPEQAEAMLAALREQAGELQRGGPREDEVQRVKNQRRTQLALEAENPRTRLMQLIDDLESRGGVQTAAARLAAVEAVSVGTINDYLREYPIAGDGLLLSCGPRSWPS